MKACPFCAEPIQDAAVVCRHCGRQLSANLNRRISGRDVIVAVIVAAAVLLFLIYRTMGIR